MGKLQTLSQACLRANSRLWVKLAYGQTPDSESSFLRLFVARIPRCVVFVARMPRCVVFVGICVLGSLCRSNIRIGACSIYKGMANNLPEALHLKTNHNQNYDFSQKLGLEIRATCGSEAHQNCDSQILCWFYLWMDYSNVKLFMLFQYSRVTTFPLVILLYSLSDSQWKD